MTLTSASGDALWPGTKKRNDENRGRARGGGKVSRFEKEVLFPAMGGADEVENSLNWTGSMPAFCAGVAERREGRQSRAGEFGENTEDKRIRYLSRSIAQKGP